MHKRILLIVAVVGAAFAASATPACSNQGEGERCDVQSTENGVNIDCQDGLVCTPRAEFTGVQSDICCPPVRANATTTICRQPPSPGGNVPPTDSGVVLPDAGPPDTAAPDTATPPDAGAADTAVAEAGEAGATD